jgi:hypothetical protein
MSGEKCSYLIREKYKIYTVVRNGDTADVPKDIAI